MKKVLLLSMPFGALERQSLGISLLKSTLNDNNIPCDIKYLTFDFADFIGTENYFWINQKLPYTAFAGDWLFTEALYGYRPDVDQAYIQEVLRNIWQLSDYEINQLIQIRSATTPFLSSVLEKINWNDYAVVGFTSTFEQNICSLALAKYLKQSFPDIYIFFGGANWEGEMGVELHQQFKFVDFACSGEADKSFPEIIYGLLKPESQPLVPKNIPGIIFREKGKSKLSAPPKLTEAMDLLPLPDYSDYFERFEQSNVPALVTPMLLVETSRGCWWGAKHHCTFCGLNGNGMAFRSKSTARVMEELDTLSEKWKITFFEVVDNILDMGYFKDLIPQLAEKNYNFFYEVKANLKREHIAAFHRAGITRIQPGIESMSNHVLKLMRKGTTFLQNILLLRLCKEYRIEVDWNILYGFPGETREDYEAMLALFPYIGHLNAPHACGPIRLDRFSPYHTNPEQFNLKNLRPLAPFKYLYPFDDESLKKIAYYFDFDYGKENDPSGYADKVIAYVNQWKEHPEHGDLIVQYTEENHLEIIDTRSNATLQKVVLTGPDKAIYEYCDTIRSQSTIHTHVHQLFPELDFSELQLVSFLDSLVANRLMVNDGNRYLSLAIGLGKMPIKIEKEAKAITAKVLA